jgi:hypothetical protein
MVFISDPMLHPVSMENIKAIHAEDLFPGASYPAIVLSIDPETFFVL